MTLIVISLATLMSLAGLRFATDIAGVVTDRQRAQLAADAAALAAIAESTPYGSGEYEAEARAFADANGARLIGCLCEPGATAVEVRVALGDATARARAVIELARLGPMSIAYDGARLHPSMRDALDALLQAAGGRVHVVSAWRDPAEQLALWERALLVHGDPEVADDWVARPGSSMHERGLAVDLGGDLELAASLVDELGLPLWRPLDHEPWHFELIGSRG